MNVCLFNHNVAWSGGTFVRCMALAKQLALNRHQVTLVTTSRHTRWTVERTTRDGVNIVEFPAVMSGRLRSGWDALDTFRRLVAVIRDEFGKPDIVHAFDSRPTVILPAIKLASRCAAALVMDWADWWGRGGTIESRNTSELTRFVARGPETWFEERFRNRAKRTTVISAALADRAVSLGVPKASITILPQGCDVDGISPIEVAVARRRCALPEGVPLIGYEGTLLKEDAPLLLNAFQSLRAADERIRLLLIGNPQFPVPDVQGLLRTGFVPTDRLSDYLGACDFFLLPLSDTIANRARWPSKINDYMAAGRPTIATPVGDLKGLFGRHEVGLLGSVDDGSFVSACSVLLGDPAARATLGRNARKLAETEMSWARIGETLISVYNEATASLSPTS